MDKQQLQSLGSNIFGGICPANMAWVMYRPYLRAGNSGVLDRYTTVLQELACNRNITLGRDPDTAMPCKFLFTHTLMQRNARRSFKQSISARPANSPANYPHPTPETLCKPQVDLITSKYEKQPLLLCSKQRFHNLKKC